MTSARDLAASILVEVVHEDVYASVALDRALERADRNARPLVTEMVYGVLRTFGFLTATLEAAAVKGVLQVEEEIHLRLQVAVFELLFLERAHAFAVVSEAVQAIRKLDEHMAPFANALLRRIAEHPPSASRARACAEGAPAWLKGALRASLGRSDSRRFLENMASVPPLGLCVARPSDREQIVMRLRAAFPGAGIEIGKRSPHAVLLQGVGDPRHLPGFGSDFIVMEEGSQCVALSVQPDAGSAVLDACAGHGNKTWLLRHAGSELKIDCSDVQPSKLAGIRGARRVFQIDWTEPQPELAGKYDHVLVDAPCSGTGTLRRRPEIALRRSMDDVRRLSELQVQILQNASQCAREDGWVIYATCSVLREECEDVVTRFLSMCSAERKPELVEAIRLLPHRDDTDGYFVARMRMGSPQK